MGIIIGSAAGYFFTTEKGKEMLQNLADNAGEVIEELQDNEIVQEKIRQAQEAVEQAKQVVSEKSQQPSAQSRRLEEPKKPRFFKRAGNPLKS